MEICAPLLYSAFSGHKKVLDHPELVISIVVNQQVLEIELSPL